MKIELSLSFFLVILIIVSLAVAPAFALGEGNRNLLLIGVLAISPIIILSSKRIKRSNVWLLLFMTSIILVPFVYQPASMRWSTVMYSIMFCLTFIAYVQLLYQDSFTAENYQKLLKYLIYAYFVVLLIQQFCVLTGLPIFNLSNYAPNEPWKLNSLAAEPSHSARIVALLMYCYISIKELIVKRKYNFHLDIKDDKWVWIAFLWTMVTMGSGTAFLFIPIILLKLIRFKSLIPLIIIFSGIVFLVNIMGINSFERTFKIFMAVLTLDVDTIMEADHSASTRIVPMIILSEMANLTTLNGWFGHGIDYVSSILSNLFPSVSEGFTGGGLLQVWIEYGFMSFILFVIFSFSNSFRKGDYLSIIFWFMLVFMNNVNSQIVWLCIVLLFTNKYFLKNIREQSKNYANE
ncbi:MAG: hypothetical protein KAI79_14840 [Bacteroidales bacterium]|nr:hypothetical protein [Bacteroidales bacterium]